MSVDMTTLSQVIDYEQMQKITSEFSRIGERCFLENAGATLYPQCLLEKINGDLLQNLYMNPHSDRYTKDCIEQIRCTILRHFNTDSSSYSVVFTSGCTQSLKLVVESFQFFIDKDDEEYGSYVYLQDNHTSVLGLREIAVDRNADVVHISHDDFLTALNQKHVTTWKVKSKKSGNTLVVYPAQSNFNGFKYPIDCMNNIRNGCLNSLLKKNLSKINCDWFILLDAAAYAATNKLDLAKVQPDFVCFSFYKLFGFPTGLGALLIKNGSENVLSQKRYFGGGTVDVVLSSEDFHVKRGNVAEKFEDGTVPFLSIIAIKHCFDTMHNLIPKVVNNDLMETISHHTYFLAKDLYHQLTDLTHQNGIKAVILYMDSNFTDINRQGGILTFNLLRDDGSYIGYAEFQHMADLFNISIRTGCFCNSGSCQRHLMVTNKEMKDMYKLGHKCGDELDLINGRPTGAVRVSFGYFNTFLDVDKLIQMICQCFVKTKIRKPRRVCTSYMETLKAKFSNGLEHLHHIINDQECSSNDSDNSSSSLDSGIELKEIAIFPIKSCGAFKITSGWKIGSKGFQYDREWMIVKDNGVCLTQKQNSYMCKIRPVIDLQKKLLILNFKGKPSISIPLDTGSENKLRNGVFCQSKVCTDLVKGFDCGDAVADWISEALEISYLRLIRQSNTDGRTQKKKSVTELKSLSLSNQAQYLLINKATVRWLGDKINEPQFTDDIDMLVDRFRGNLVIDMETELAERDWNKVVIGNHEFQVDGQCNRCQMVCIDQQTGEKTVEPLRTISEQFAGKLRFGIYLTYIGTIDGSKDKLLKTNTSLKPFISDIDLSR